MEIVATPDVIVYCDECHDCEAPEYRIRRSGGKYILLCYKDGQGCWERSPKTMCQFTDFQGVQCELAAEWHISYGACKVASTCRCSIHVAPALTDVGEHLISAL